MTNGDKRLSVVIALGREDQDPRPCLRRLAALGKREVELLVVAMGPAEEHLPELAQWSREAGIRLELLNQPSRDWGEAANLGLASASAPVVLFLAPHLSPPPDLLPRLDEHFADSSVAAVGGSLQAGAEAPEPAHLAALDFAFRSEELALHPAPVLWAHCAAFDRRLLLQTGGMATGEGRGGGPIPTPCGRLAALGRRLVFDPQLRPRTGLPATWGGYLAGEVNLGRTLFLTRRRGPEGQRPGLTSRGLILQPLLALAALGLLIVYLPSAPGRAITLAAIALLLLYPLNRPFLKQVIGRQPGLVNKAMLICLIRPFVWCVGMVDAAVRRLTGTET